MKSDEIINTLLRTNFENIKDVDESLDIDLSICAAIPVTNNSYSFPGDFWTLEGGGVDFLNTTTTTIISNIKRAPPSGKKQSISPVQNTSETSIKNEPKVENFPKIKLETFEENKEDKIQEKTDENLKKSHVKFKYKCEECSIISENIDEFDTIKHEAGHTVNIICEECDKVCRNEIDLKKHIKTHKNGIRRSALMECPDCGKSLKLGSMWMHRKIHSNTKQYNCDICGQKFVQKINLTHHLKHHNAEKPFECPECRKTFPERSHMIRHQKYHSDQRPYKCEKCGKMYKTERCLKVHSLVHLDQRPFVCNVCNKSFLSNSKLKQHSNIHTGERPYKCNYCSRDFTNFPNWLKHTRRRHNVDHKTGEILQNVPSYCLKQKKQKKANVKKTSNCKKITKNVIAIKNEIIDELQKQFQHDAKHIKFESKTTSIDLHCLSITSAEDLIMEQALEMEEAGYFNNNKNVNINNELKEKLNFIDRVNFYDHALSSLSSIESPLSSPASDFQSYIPSLPPIKAININNNKFFSSSVTTNSNNNSTTQQTLPSMETFFGTNGCQQQQHQQKEQSE